MQTPCVLRPLTQGHVCVQACSSALTRKVTLVSQCVRLANMYMYVVYSHFLARKECEKYGRVHMELADSRNVHQHLASQCLFPTWRPALNCWSPHPYEQPETCAEVEVQSYSMLPKHTPCREAGLSVQEVLDVPGTNLKEQLEQGPWGLRRLREAGYCASELVAYGGNFANPWILKQAGFSLMELYTVGFSQSELRAAGFGDPGLQPATGPASRSMQSMIEAEIPNTVAVPWSGTRAPQWKELLKRRAAQQQGAPLQDSSRTSVGQPASPSQSPTHTLANVKEVRRTFSMMLGVPSRA